MAWRAVRAYLRRDVLQALLQAGLDVLRIDVEDDVALVLPLRVEDGGARGRLDVVLLNRRPHGLGRLPIRVADVRGDHLLDLALRQLLGDVTLVRRDDDGELARVLVHDG